MGRYSDTLRSPETVSSCVPPSSSFVSNHPARYAWPSNVINFAFRNTLSPIPLDFFVEAPRKRSPRSTGTRRGQRRWAFGRHLFPSQTSPPPQPISAPSSSASIQRQVRSCATQRTHPAGGSDLHDQSRNCWIHWGSWGGLTTNIVSGCIQRQQRLSRDFGVWQGGLESLVPYIGWLFVITCCCLILFSYNLRYLSTYIEHTKLCLII